MGDVVRFQRVATVVLTLLIVQSVASVGLAGATTGNQTDPAAFAANGPSDGASVEARAQAGTLGVAQSTGNGLSTYNAQRGVATHNGFAYVVDEEKIKKIDLSTHETVNSFEAPDGRWRGLAYGDGSLWFADGVDPDYDGEILELDPETGDVRSRIDTFYDPRGLAFAEGSLWVVDITTNDVVEYSTDGTELGRFGYSGPTGSTWGLGLAYSEGTFWLGTGDGGLHEFAADGTYVGEVASRDANYGGLATNATALLGPDENGDLSVLQRLGGSPVDQPVATVDERSVLPGGTVTFRVNSSTAGQLSIEGDLANWTVTETTPATLTTYPGPGQTPYESRGNDTWGHIFPAVDAHSFEVTAVAPNATGTYDFTAIAEVDESSAESSVSVEVTESATHESGVSQALFAAVTGDDGALERSDVIGAVNAYLGSGSVEGEAISRADVLALVQYYLSN